MSNRNNKKDLEELEQLVAEIKTNDFSINNNYDAIHNRKNKEYETSNQFKKHSNEIRNVIIEEYRSKRKLRKVSYFILVLFALVILLFTGFFIFFKAEKVPLSLSITLVVGAFANLSALFAIIFRYVFSSTTELTDYAKYLLDHEKTKD